MELESFKKVVERQVPIDIGRPIPMIVYHLDHPKNCGDPWIGAYSKHGFWYKFSDGTNDDYQKVVAEAYNSDSYHMDYNSLKIWKAMSDYHYRFIVAKNQSGQVLGSIGIAYFNDYAVIGIYYVIEEYRHSGIGPKLFNEALKIVGGRGRLLFHSMSHLVNKCDRFGFTTSVEQEWKFVTYEISNPSALPELQDRNVTIIKYSDLSDAELAAMLRYDNEVTCLNREIWLKEWLKQTNFNTFIAFKEKKVIGYGCSREVAGGYVLPLLIGPLYADNVETASALIYATLKKYYNPEDDYEWDPDVFAIYRRNVYFTIPEQNTQMIGVMEKLKGGTGMLRKSQLFYATQATDNLPNADFSKIFSVSDIHMSIV